MMKYFVILLNCVPFFVRPGIRFCSYRFCKVNKTDIVVDKASFFFVSPISRVSYHGNILIVDIYFFKGIVSLLFEEEEDEAVKLLYPIHIRNIELMLCEKICLQAQVNKQQPNGNLPNKELSCDLRHRFTPYFSPSFAIKSIEKKKELFKR